MASEISEMSVKEIFETSVSEFIEKRDFTELVEEEESEFVCLVRGSERDVSFSDCPGIPFISFN